MIRVSIFDNEPEAVGYASKLHKWLLINREGYNATSWQNVVKAYSDSAFAVKLPTETDIDFEQEYNTVNVKRYGAMGDGVTDDTSAFQTAINYCVLNKQTLIIPTGTFIITQTLIVTGTISMVGNGKENTIIKSSAINLFSQGDNYSLYPHRISNIWFKNTQISSNAILFNLSFGAALIKNCKAELWNTIFNRNVKQVTKILENTFYSITGNFISSNGGFTDSQISFNYISGYQPSNPICFAPTTIVNTVITNNYFDFFKYCLFADASNYASSYCTGNIISNNIFEYMFRCIVGQVYGSTISNNHFQNIESSIMGEFFTNPDTEMLNNTPYAIYSSGNYAMNRINILDNQFKCNGIYLNTPQLNINISNNIYSNPEVNFAITFKPTGSQVSTKCFIDFMDKTNETVLPTTSWILGNGTYYGREIYLNDKLLRFIPIGESGKWVDMLGNLIT